MHRNEIKDIANSYYRMLWEKNIYYSLPEDKSQLLFDFYLLTLLWQMQGTQIKDESIKYSLDEAVTERLVPQLKDHLLQSVLFAIAAEYRHVFSRNNGESIITHARKSGITNATKFIRAYRVEYTTRTDTHYSDMRRASNTPKLRIFTNEKRGYLDSYKAIIKSLKTVGMSIADFMELAKKSFLDLSWDKSYGGEPWSAIVDGWFKLYHAQSTNDIIVWIDHIYDLQHNTDTVFNKLKSYYNNGYNWIYKALEKKKHAVTPWALYDDASISAKQLTGYVLKDLGFGTLENYIKKLDDERQAVDVHAAKLKASKRAKPHASTSGPDMITDDPTGNSKSPLVADLSGLVPRKSELSLTQAIDTKSSRVWHDGIWKGGTWKNGNWLYGLWRGDTWENGTWKNGIWKNGIWKDGTWKNGTWESGRWENGWWQDGIWYNGTWYNGTWKDGTWKTGRWKNGIWENGTWENGTWENGIWSNGIWNNGIWHNGAWMSGTWKDGVWKDGTIKSEMLPGFIIYSKINPAYLELFINNIFLSRLQNIAPAVYIKTINNTKLSTREARYVIHIWSEVANIDRVGQLKQSI